MSEILTFKEFISEQEDINEKFNPYVVKFKPGQSHGGKKVDSSIQRITARNAKEAVVKVVKRLGLEPGAAGTLKTEFARINVGTENLKYT